MGWLHFDGVDDYVDIGDKSSLEGFDELTLIVAFKIFAYPTSETYGYFLAGKELVYKIDVNKAGQVRFLTGEDWGVSILYTPYRIDLNKMYVVAGVYDGTVKKLYVNGVQEDTKTTSGNVGTNTNTVSIGATPDYDAGYTYGNIYSVILYGRHLDDEEITQITNYIMSGEGEMITDGLVLWLDGDSIDPVNGIWRDKSGNGNDGIIYGATYIEPIMKVWDGSAWKDIQNIYYWNGTSWCLPKNVFYWDGSQWVPFWTPPYEVIWHCDYDAHKVYELSTSDLSVVRSASSPDSLPWGIGGDTDTIWLCDSDADKVYELSTTDLSVIRSASSPSTSPSGIGGDANVIWHCDNNFDRVYELSTTDFSVVRSASSPTSSPMGIGGDVDVIWHCELVTVYELSTTDFSVVRSASPTSVPRGIGGDTDTIWYSDAGADKVYELSTVDFGIMRSTSSPSTNPVGIGGK